MSAVGVAQAQQITPPVPRMNLDMSADIGVKGSKFQRGSAGMYGISPRLIENLHLSEAQK